MSRLSRKNRQLDLSGGGLLDLMDNYIKKLWRIDDLELDRIFSKMSDEDLEFFIQDGYTFEEKRKLVLLIEKYISPKNFRNDQIDRII
jgi:hypothetical protein